MEAKRAAAKKAAARKKAVAKKAAAAVLVWAASALPEKADATELEFQRAQFIRQSFLSNYCGVYATGMFLSLLGFPTTRERALNLFNLERSNPNYEGTNHEEIGEVLGTTARFRSLHWHYSGCFDFASLAVSLANQIKTHGPTLLSFGAIHKNGKWKCTHVVVVVGVTKNRIALLDPLAKPPLVSWSGNVYLDASSRGSVNVLGSSYTINLKSETAVLRWAGRRPHAKNWNQ